MKAKNQTYFRLQEKCVEFNRLKHKMEAHNDGSLDFVFKMKHMEMKLEMEIRYLTLTRYFQQC